MSSEKEIVIKDACILFDLVDLNLLKDFFQLEISAFTTPQVIAEITNEAQWAEISTYINLNKLQIEAEGKLETIVNLYEEHAGLSIADCSVLELALRRDAIIFSSDGSLRKLSIKKNLTVRGILWIIEKLHYQGVITANTATEKLKLYSQINQRAPLSEIEKFLIRIKESKLK